MFDFNEFAIQAIENKGLRVNPFCKIAGGSYDEVHDRWKLSVMIAGFQGQTMIPVTVDRTGNIFTWYGVGDDANYLIQHGVIIEKH